jgi:hypothetical protein
MQFLVSRIADLSETQYRIFLLAQALVVKHAKEASPAPIDSDVAEGIASVAATLETAGKGIIYEHRAASIPAQRLATEVSAAIRDLAGRAGSGAARFERDAATALRALERTAREAGKEASDASHPEASWLTLASRVMSGGGAGSGV